MRILWRKGGARTPNGRRPTKVHSAQISKFLQEYWLRGHATALVDSAHLELSRHFATHCSSVRRSKYLVIDVFDAAGFFVGQCSKFFLPCTIGELAIILN